MKTARGRQQSRGQPARSGRRQLPASGSGRLSGRRNSSTGQRLPPGGALSALKQETPLLQ